MKYLTKILVLISLFVLSCTNSILEEVIQAEYEKLKEDSDLKIVSIQILEEHNITFEQLANSEFNRMINLNEELNKLVEIQFEIDSLLRNNIDQRNCFHNNANKEYQLKYESENRNDSIKIKKGLRSRLYNQLEFQENELKMHEIGFLVKSESTLLEKSKWVKHEVTFETNKHIVRDTVIYIEIGATKYSYLTDNIYRNNK